MSDKYPPAMQREALDRFAAALGSRAAALTRDECGDPTIRGKHGHVYAVCGSLDRPDMPGFQLCLDTESARGWTFAKRALSFAALTNDGDGDGALFLDRLPSKAEAVTIRDCLGIAKKRAVSEVELARLRSMSATFSPLRPRPSLIDAKAA
jgi:hypothetical protein